VPAHLSDKSDKTLTRVRAAVNMRRNLPGKLFRSAAIWAERNCYWQSREPVTKSYYVQAR
jgi:hypothetical protein